MRVWLPFSSVPKAISALGGEIEGIEIDVFNADGVYPDSIGDVEFFVLPYMVSAERALARVGEMKSLKVIQLYSAGYENYIPYVPKGVTLCNGAGIHDTATSELAVSIALANLRELDVYARNMETGCWKTGFGDSLADKRITIFGYGRIGKAIEQRVAGFEPASITRVARTEREENGFPVRSFAQFDEILPQTDVLFLISPLTDQTEGIVNARALSLLPDGALVVNASRGKVVDTDALVAECASGRLRASLDVTDPEPLPADHPLWHTKGVYISPHVGGQSKAFFSRSRRFLEPQLRRFAAGEPLANVVLDGAKLGE
jgi:phosphoglycerate dehydrogenase-like enzyme